MLRMSMANPRSRPLFQGMKVDGHKPHDNPTSWKNYIKKLHTNKPNPKLTLTRWLVWIKLIEPGLANLEF